MATYICVFTLDVMSKDVMFWFIFSFPICYVTAGRSVFDVNGAVVSLLARAGLRRATKGVCRGDNC